jgi:hypothetical protein
MQINISNRGAVLLALTGALGGAVVFAPDQVNSVIDMVSSAVSGL